VMFAAPTGKDVVYQIVYGTTSAILIVLAVALLILLPGGIYYVSARTEGATLRESIFNWPLVTLAGIVVLLSLV
jgi:ABC-type dipeptide/oligopeptide/nickel transport system permease subunit